MQALEEGDDMRSVAMMFAGLMMGVSGFATMAGCSPTTAQAQACPAGVPWVPADYANGKFVPGHCQGQAAQ
jgi:hypothetical protein